MPRVPTRRGARFDPDNPYSDSNPQATQNLHHPSPATTIQVATINRLPLPAATCKPATCKLPYAVCRPVEHVRQAGEAGRLAAGLSIGSLQVAGVVVMMVVIVVLVVMIVMVG